MTKAARFFLSQAILPAANRRCGICPGFRLAVLVLAAIIVFCGDVKAQSCHDLAQRVASGTGAEIAPGRTPGTFQLSHPAAPGGSQVVCGAPSVMFSAYATGSSPAFLDYVVSAGSAMTKSDAGSLRKAVDNCVASGAASLEIPVGVDMRGVSVECLVSKLFGGNLSITIFRRRDF